MIPVSSALLSALRYYCNLNLLHYLLPVKVPLGQMVLRPTLGKATCYGRDFVSYCIFMHFENVLVFLMNNNFHEGVCY